MNMVKLTKLVKKVQQGIEKLGIDIQSLTDFAENEVDETVSKSKISAAENAGETLKRRTRQAKETTEVEAEAPKQRRRRRTKEEIEADRKAEAEAKESKRRTRQAKETTEVEAEAPKQRRRRVNATPAASTPRNKRSAFAESVL